MQVVGIKSFNTDYQKYQQENIEYNMEALRKEIKTLYPDVDPNTINLNDPRFKPIIEKMPYCPSIMGNMSDSLGIKGQFLTLELWENLFHSWCPVDNLPADSALWELAEDTPRGKMVKLNKNATPISDDGHFTEQAKTHRTGNEMLFTMGKGLSVFFTALQAEDPQALTKLNKAHQRVMNSRVIPQLREAARVKLGEDGLILKQGMEIMCVDFMHTENRPSEDEDPKKRKKAKKETKLAIPEPHIHWHNFIVNSCIGEDGKVYSLSTDDIYQDKKMLSTIWMKGMMDELEREFGLKFEPVYAKGDETKPEDERTIITYDISSEIVPSDTKAKFMKRSIQMAKSIKDKGLDVTTGAMQLAQVERKQDKLEMSPSQLITAWDEAYKEIGFDIKKAVQKLDLNQVKPENPQVNYTRMVRNFHEHKYLQNMQQVANAKNRLNKTNKVKNDDNDAYISDLESEQVIKNFHRDHKEYSFTETQFKAYVITQLAGVMDWDSAEEAATRLFEKEALIHMEPKKLERYREYLAGDVSPHDAEQFRLRYVRDVSFTSRYMKTMAESIDIGLNARRDESHFVLNRELMIDILMQEEVRMTTIIRAKNPDAPPFKLAAAQREAAIMGVTQNGAAAVIKGPPGTGKSTIAKSIKVAYTKMGYEVLATSIGSAATEGLAKDCGIAPTLAANTTQLLMELDSGKRVLTNKSVLLFDEAGMAGVETNARLLEHVHKARAKVIFIGDHQQIAPVEAGGVFQHLVNRFPTVELTEINRHRQEEHKVMSRDLMNGRAKKAFMDAYDRGEIHIYDTVEETQKAIAEAYMADPTSPKDKKVTSSLNRDVDDINELIRSAMQEAGHLTKNPEEQVEVECKDGVTRAFAKGDRIIFDKNTKSDEPGSKKKVKNSYGGEVEDLIRNSKGVVTSLSIRMDRDDELITVDVSKRHPPIKGGMAQTINKSQGATYENTYSYISGRASLNQIYVQNTRHKGQNHIFMAREIMDKIVMENAEIPPTLRQVNAVKWIATKHGIDPAPEALLTFGGARAFLNEHYLSMADVKNHVMDDFSDLLDSFSQLNLKKSVSDFEYLQGSAKDIYDADRAMIKQKAQEYDARQRLQKLQAAAQKQDEKSPSASNSQVRAMKKTKKKSEELSL